MKLSLDNLLKSRWPLIALGVVGGALLIWLTLEMTGVFEPPKRIAGPNEQEKKVDPNRCPQCNAPLSKYAREKGECLLCNAKLENEEDKSISKTVAWVVPPVLIGVFSVLLVINLGLFTYKRVRQKNNGEEVFHHITCRKCDRRIRYRDRQVNQFARCPLCKSIVRFPAPPLELTRWGKVRAWVIARLPRWKKSTHEPQK
jgi:uncharacterized paraquat-inducible protein A